MNIECCSGLAEISLSTNKKRLGITINNVSQAYTVNERDWYAIRRLIWRVNELGYNDGKETNENTD